MAMDRRTFLAGLAAPAPAARVLPRPNILWITCEDMSPQLGCYGDPLAATPNIDRLAREGVRFTHAFASAPVCSAARSCLITGMYPTALGTSQHRSAIVLPPEVRGFPAWLREAGYYCTNNAKTDYNLRDEPAFIRDAWDESGGKAHWRGRKPGQPFFSVFNFLITHQSRTTAFPYAEFEKIIRERLSPAERTPPGAVTVPPYFPDTPVVRRTLAREYDCIRALDKVDVARVLGELEEDGLAADTIVFFYSDHGSGLPRGKRTPYDRGLRVPLVIRFPEKHRRLAPAAPGAVSGRLVSFVDFGPSVLSLAGVPVPRHMQGRAFLGPQAAPPRETVYAYRDRIDEAFDCVRAVRDRRWLYIRNYHPHVSWHQPEDYSKNEEIRAEISRLAAEGKLNEAQMAYARPGKPAEELYDTETDPHQAANLAAVPEARVRLARMRRLLHNWMRSNRDLGLFPEAEMISRARDGSPRRIAYPFSHVLEAAERAGRPGAAARAARDLGNPHPAIRFWGAVTLRADLAAAGERRVLLRKALDDPSPDVRLEAASTLAALGEEIAGRILEILTAGLGSANPVEAARAARILESLGGRARPAWPAMKEALAAVEARKPGGAGYDYAIAASLRAAAARMTI